MSAIGNFRNYLKKLQDEKRLGDLIEATGMSPDTVYGYLTKREPNLSQAERIAGALGITLAELIGNDPPPPSPPPHRPPNQLEVALYLFDHAQSLNNPLAVQLFKRALESPEAEVKVMIQNLDSLLADASKADSSTSG